MRRSQDNSEARGSVIGCVVVLGVIAVTAFLMRGTEDFANVYVKEKQAVVQDKESKYLIFTNSEVFEDTDTAAYFKWNSSDVYNQLEVGHTYRCRVCGWRFQLFSHYRNIIEVLGEEHGKTQ